MASSFAGSTRRSTTTMLTSEVGRKRPSAAEPNSTTERRSSANTRCAAPVNSLSAVRTASGSSADPAAMGQRSGTRSGVEAVEPGGVGAGDLELVLGARILEVARDDLLRVRPGRGLVRVVGRPHHLVDADEMAAGDADEVVDIGGPHLALEVFARLELIGEAGGDALALEGAVHALQIIGQPADIVLGGDELQLWKAVEHAGEDQDAERFLDLVRQHRGAHIALAPIVLALDAH